MDHSVLPSLRSSLARRAVRLVLGSALLCCGLPGEAVSQDYDPTTGLNAVKERYRTLSSYRDRGSIRIETAGREPRTHRFSTRSDGQGGIVFELTQPRGERVVAWSDATGAYQFRGDWMQVRPAASPLAGLAQLVGARPGLRTVNQAGLGQDYEAKANRGATLGLDAGSFGTFTILHQLGAFPGPSVLDAPTATDRGVEPCGRNQCHRIEIAAAATGLASTTLSIDRTSLLILGIEHRIGGDEEIEQRGLSSTARGKPATTPTSGVTVVVHVEEIEAGTGPTERVSFRPPEAARWVDVWEPPGRVGSSDSARPPDVPADDLERRPVDALLVDEISVRLVTTEVRALDRHGRPLRNLEAADFRVVLGRRILEVVAVDWRSSSEPLGHDLSRLLDPSLLSADLAVDPPGQLVVFFVQTDARSRRFIGLRRLLADPDLVGLLAPQDRAAVVSFGSRLDLVLDFTRSRDRLAASLREAAVPVRTRRPEMQTAPSLEALWDDDRARSADSAEEALELVGGALGQLPGAKSLVFLGWGLGRFGREGVRMTPAFERARRVLNRQRIPVFVLDTSDTEEHTLEVGLRTIADETGGLYTKTRDFAATALRQVSRAMSGSYILTLSLGDHDLPSEVSLDARLRIELTRRRGTILHVGG